MSDPRFVLLSDLHAHPWSAFAQHTGLQNTRLRRSLNILGASLQRARDEDIPWVFAGDLVHTAGYALNTVLSGVTQVLHDYKDVRKIVVWGNHDARGIGGLITIDQTVFAALAHAVPMTVLDPTVIPKVEAGGLTFAGAGYQPHTKSLIFPPPADVGIYHQTVRGSTTATNFELEGDLDPQELLARHRLSIVGHVHHLQEIDAPLGQGILIPGSPEHHNFGDTGDHGWWVVTLPEEDHPDDCAMGLGGGCDCGAAIDPDLEFVSGGSPQFLTVDTPADIGKNDGHFYRIRSMPKGAVLPDGVIAVAPTPTTVKHRDLLRGVTEVDQILQVWLSTQAPPKGADNAVYLTAGRELLVMQDPTQLRDVRLTQLRLYNFCCFERENITIHQGVRLIQGRGRDFTSNGAGKSSLIGEPLYWLLFGRTTKDLAAEDVIRWGTKTCEVSADFTDGEDLLHVWRRRGPDGHTLEVTSAGVAWEATSVTEMTTLLGHYLGITPEIFQNLAYFSQEKLLLFSSATDGQRKDVLSDLIGLNGYQDASSAAQAEVSKQDMERVRWDTRAEMLVKQQDEAERETEAHQRASDAWEQTLAQWIKHSEVQLEDLLATNILVSEHEAARHIHIGASAAALVDHYTTRQATERDAITERVRTALLAEHQQKLEALVSKLHTQSISAGAGFPSLTSAQQAVTKLPQHQQRLTGLEEQHTQDNQDRTDLRVAQSTLESTLGHWRPTTLNLSGQLAEAEAALLAGVCPTCQQPVTDAHREQCLAPLRKQLDEAKAQCAAHEAELDGVSARHQVAEETFAKSATALQERRTLLARLHRTAELVQEVAITSAEITHTTDATIPKSLLAERVDYQQELELRAFQQKQLARVDLVRQAIEERHAARAVAIDEAQATLNRYHAEQNPHTALMQATRQAAGTAAQEIALAAVALEEIEVTIAMYEYWRVGFSKQGLQSLLVEEVATRFNASRADIFPLLTQGIYDVQFSTLSTTRGGELREKTKFVVYAHGKPVPYNSLSGGQRRRVDIGIMLVLTQSVAQWMGVRGVLGLLILDEVFSFLDASGAEGLVAALGQVVEQIPTIFVITHDTHLQAMVPEIIQVEQGADGISHIV